MYYLENRRELQLLPTATVLRLRAEATATVLSYLLLQPFEPFEASIGRQSERPEKVVELQSVQVKVTMSK